MTSVMSAHGPCGKTGGTRNGYKIKKNTHCGPINKFARSISLREVGLIRMFMRVIREEETLKKGARQTVGSHVATALLNGSGRKMR